MGLEFRLVAPSCIPVHPIIGALCSPECAMAAIESLPGSVRLPRDMQLRLLVAETHDARELRAMQERLGTFVAGRQGTGVPAEGTPNGERDHHGPACEP
jgi:hypothetical protein